MTRSVGNRKNGGTPPESAGDGQEPGSHVTTAPSPVADDSAASAETPAPDYTRRIEIRLALPAPPVRYEKGKTVRDPAPDMQRIITAIRPFLEAQTLTHHGAQTELLITASRAPGVRITGTFEEKASAVESRVQGWLDKAFDALTDLDG